MLPDAKVEEQQAESVNPVLIGIFESSDNLRFQVTVSEGRSSSNISTAISGGLHDFVSKSSKGFDVTAKTVDASTYKIKKFYDLLRSASSDYGYPLPSILPPARSGLVTARYEGLPSTIDEQYLLSTIGKKIEGSYLKPSFISIHKHQDSREPRGQDYARDLVSPVRTYPQISTSRRPSILRRIKWRLRSLGRRQHNLNRHKRVRKSHSFLILWIGAFLVGYLLASMNVILLALVSLIDATILFIPLFILWWLFHKRIAGKVLAGFLIVVFAIFVYQSPNTFNRHNLTNDFYGGEASFVTSFYSSTPGISSTTSSPNVIQQIVSDVQPVAINSQWADSFFAIVNSYRSSSLTESSTLDQFAQIRFNTLSSNYEISHYHYQQDFDSFFGSQSISGGEEYFYPDSSAASYVKYIQNQAPVHWQGLLDPEYAHFGYYIGKGSVIEIYQPCSAPSEIVGSINETQQLIQYGCQYTVSTATYFVVELTS